MEMCTLRVSRSFVAVLFVVAVIAAVWLVSTRTQPAFAVYDPVPSAAAPVPPRPQTSAPVPDTIHHVPVRPARPARTQPPRQRPAAAAVIHPDTDSVAAHPHRSDNYGGYGGYGSRERRAPPHGK